MHTVAVAVLPRAPIFELAVPCEVFGLARPELADPWYDLRLCPVRPEPVVVGAGFTLDSPYRLADLVAADTVIVPACGNLHADSPPELIDALRAAHARGARIAAICSGSFALAAAGLLDGRRATCHWMHAAELARRFPRVQVDPAVLYTGEDRIFTSAGTAAGLDLCLELVRLDHGTAVANALARRLVVPPHRDGGQAQYVESPMPARDTGGIGPTLEWALRRLDQPVTLADLARAAHVSPRTLARRFQAAVGMSPLRWLLAQRIRRARQLLESSDVPVERIAEMVGLGSPANLRRHFLAATGVSPQAYRRTFRAAPAA